MDIKAYIESGIIESYVLGLATPEEEAELLQLSHIYPELKAAMGDCEKWLSEVSDQYAIKTPDDVKTQLLTRLHHEFRGPEQRIPVSHHYRGNLFKYAAVLTLFLLAISGLLNMYLYNRYQQASRDFVQLQSQRDMLAADNRAFQAKMDDLGHDIQFITAPGTMKISLLGVSGREGNQVTLYWNEHTKLVYLNADNLPEPPKGKQYQLWALVDGKPMSAGVLEKNCRDLCALPPVQQAQAFAITLEKNGGSATPTMNQMFVFGKVSI